jgi:mRNA interferase MazF
MAARRTAGYIPDRGDLVWLDFTPHAGHEQGGRRPALVLSPRAYNSRAGLMLACPITNQVKGYPFEVLLPPALAATGAVLSDHVKSIDFAARRTEPIGKVPDSVIDDVVAKLTPLLSK